jgi:hypothetical protein
MKAIIIAENSQCLLSPLTDRTPHALLPVAGKTILMHALETLHRSEILDVTVVSASYCAELESEIDTGPLIGMDVSDHILMIGLKDIVDTDWEDVLDDLGDLKVHALMSIRMTVSAQPVALVLPPGFGDRIPIDWGDVHHIDAIHWAIGNPISSCFAKNSNTLNRRVENIFQGIERHRKPVSMQNPSSRTTATLELTVALTRLLA